MEFETTTQGVGGYSTVSAPSLPVGTRRSGSHLGILLIIIGSVLLFARLIPGMTWAAWWPLIIVVTGFVKAFTPSARYGWGIDRLADGFGTALFGLVLLGNTTGYISWSVWWTLLMLWPLLLISAGIQLLGRAAGQPWIRVFGPVLLWVAMFYAVSTAWTGAYGIAPLPALTTNYSAETFSLGGEPVGSIQTAVLDYEGGAGIIKLGAGSALADISGASAFGTPRFSIDRNGTEANVSVKPDAQSVPLYIGNNTNTTSVLLSRDVLWDAHLQTGACRLEADLTNVPVKRLTLETGASQSTVKLGQVPLAATGSTLEVNAGAAEVRVLVPASAAVRIESEGLVSTSVPAGYVRNGGVWESPNAESASRTWTIHSESGLGAINVETY